MQSEQMAQKSTGDLAVAIGTGGTDPFSSCSLHATPRINILIDHCKDWVLFGSDYSTSLKNHLSRS